MISSLVRATKFHHISIGSASGSPPRTRKREPCKEEIGSVGNAGRDQRHPSGLDDVLSHPDRTVQWHHCILEIGLGWQFDTPGAHRDVGADHSRVDAGLGFDVTEGAHHHHRVGSGKLCDRELSQVLEARGTVPRFLRLREPHLDPLDPAAGAQLGVGNPLARGHQVELTGADELL